MKSLTYFKHNAVNTAFVYTLLLIMLIVSFSSCNGSGVQKSAVDSNRITEDQKKDAQFLIDAAEINMEEIKLGQLAQQNSMMSEVQELGKMMETEHTKCLNDLKMLAEKKAISLPTTITKEGEEAYQKLITESASDFDKKYCSMMVDGHKTAISKFEKASADCVDVDIRTWATETLPSLRKHLDHSIYCQKNLSKI
jgi:putative membrane protein